VLRSYLRRWIQTTWVNPRLTNRAWRIAPMWLDPPSRSTSSRAYLAGIDAHEQEPSYGLHASQTPGRVGPWRGRQEAGAIGVIVEGRNSSPVMVSAGESVYAARVSAAARARIFATDTL